MTDKTRAALRFDQDYAETLRMILDKTLKLTKLSLQTFSSHPNTIAAMICVSEKDDMTALATALIPFRERLDVLDHLMADQAARDKFYALETREERGRFFIERGTTMLEKEDM